MEIREIDHRRGKWLLESMERISQWGSLRGRIVNVFEEAGKKIKTMAWKGGSGMWCRIFKNGAVYPIRLVNLAHVMTYVKSIDVEARDSLLHRVDSDYPGPHIGRNGLHVRPFPRPRV